MADEKTTKQEEKKEESKQSGFRTKAKSKFRVGTDSDIDADLLKSSFLNDSNINSWIQYNGYTSGQAREFKDTINKLKERNFSEFYKGNDGIIMDSTGQFGANDDFAVYYHNTKDKERSGDRFNPDRGYAKNYSEFNANSAVRAYIDYLVPYVMDHEKTIAPSIEKPVTDVKPDAAQQVKSEEKKEEKKQEQSTEQTNQSGQELSQNNTSALTTSPEQVFQEMYQNYLNDPKESIKVNLVKGTDGKTIDPMMIFSVGKDKWNAEYKSLYGDQFTKGDSKKIQEAYLRFLKNPTKYTDKNLGQVLQLSMMAKPNAYTPLDESNILINDTVNENTGGGYVLNTSTGEIKYINLGELQDNVQAQTILQNLVNKIIQSKQGITSNKNGGRLTILQLGGVIAGTPDDNFLELLSEQVAEAAAQQQGMDVDTFKAKNNRLFDGGQSLMFDATGAQKIDTPTEFLNMSIHNLRRSADIARAAQAIMAFLPGIGAISPLVGLTATGLEGIADHYDDSVTSEEAAINGAKNVALSLTGTYGTLAKIVPGTSKLAGLVKSLVPKALNFASTVPALVADVPKLLVSGNKAIKGDSDLTVQDITNITRGIGTLLGGLGGFGRMRKHQDGGILQPENDLLSQEEYDGIQQLFQQYIDRWDNFQKSLNKMSIRRQNLANTKFATRGVLTSTPESQNYTSTIIARNGIKLNTNKIWH